MTMTYCIDRFDQYDYQKFGLTDRWKLCDAVELLVNFYMESKGLHDSVDSLKIINKLYANYYKFLYGNLSAKNISYLNIYNEADEIPDPDDGSIADTIATLDKYELLEYLNKNTALKLDIELLKRFISGDETPATPLSAVIAISENKPNVATDAIRHIENDAVVIPIAEPSPETVITRLVADEDVKAKKSASTGHQYSFIKTGRSWNIHFGEIDLPDVKHLTGMDYIKTLLQRPHYEIGVLDIQAMMNPDINLSSKAKKSRDVLIDHKDGEEPLHSRHSEAATNYGGSKTNISDEVSDDIEDDQTGDEPTEALKKALERLSGEKRERVATLYKQVEENKTRLEEAKENNDTIEASRLTTLVNMLQDDMYNILYDRSDDPELDKNRKRVRKNIEDARNNIKLEEISKGYDDTPIYNYLKKYIETGYTCKYNPLVDDPIHWIF